MRFLARALFWLAASAGLLLAGFALLAALLLIPSIASRGELPGDVQRQALGLVYSTIATQALLPELVLAFASWLVLARIVPALELSGRALAIALPLLAAAWFPLVGHYSFGIWSPSSPRDYAMTLLLVAGGAALALLVPRALSAALAPGCFAPQGNHGMVRRDE
jgi:hypothetical protein